MVAPNPATVSLPLASRASLGAGTRLGRYEVISELGTGGMATVYFGRALAAAGFQRLVAIKLLHPHLLKDPQFVRMFLDEGRLAARVQHPNVVATLDLEHTAEALYLVMEYIEGDQLLGLYKNARAHGKRIPFGITLRIGLDILAGLHAAHELTDDEGNPLKMVHRDVSPHNILVGSDGVSRITDFGIAKAEERIADTREGIVKGKLSYMAPEQSNEAPVDRRADVFSAATVIWECFTGRRLFPGKSDGEVLRNLLQNPIPRLREVDPALPQQLDDVLSRALDRDPERRYPTAHSLGEALENAVASAPDLVVSVPRIVAQYVKQMAADKISGEQRERRAHPTQRLPVFRPDMPAAVAQAAVAQAPPPAPSAFRVPRPPPIPVLPPPATVPLVPGAAGPQETPSDEGPTAVQPTPSAGVPPPVLEPRSEASASTDFELILPESPAAIPSYPPGTLEPLPPSMVPTQEFRLPEEGPRPRVVTLLVLLFGVVILGSSVGYAIWTIAGRRVRPTRAASVPAEVTIHVPSPTQTPAALTPQGDPGMATEPVAAPSEPSSVAAPVLAVPPPSLAVLQPPVTAPVVRPSVPVRRPVQGPRRPTPPSAPPAVPAATQAPPAPQPPPAPAPSPPATHDNLPTSI
ncbi:MAG: protein kinase [Deltaproteobacteria bacterium]|nr:protein kinase [Deltaproteobacteria bacterium]